MKNFFLYLMVFATMCISFTACGDDDEEEGGVDDSSLVGSWVQVRETDTNNETGESSTYADDAKGFVFNKDGSGEEIHYYNGQYYSPSSSPIMWKTSGDSLIIIDADDGYIDSYAYGMSGSQLWLEQLWLKYGETEVGPHTYRMYFAKE